LNAEPPHLLLQRVDLALTAIAVAVPVALTPGEARPGHREQDCEHAETPTRDMASENDQHGGVIDRRRSGLRAFGEIQCLP
jgi:hypothetical protein